MRDRLPGAIIGVEMILEECSRLLVKIFCGIILSQSAVENTELQTALSEHRWIFIIWMAHSAAFVICIGGGTS